MEEIIRKREEQRTLFLSEIERVGMTKFSEIFYGMVEKQEYGVNPEEFFSDDPVFVEIYKKLQKEFHLNLFRAFLPFAKPAQFATTLACLGEHDFPKGWLLAELDNTPPPLEELDVRDLLEKGRHAPVDRQNEVLLEQRVCDNIESRQRKEYPAIYEYMESSRK